MNCCICGSKHQLARNSDRCKSIKGNLPIFTEFVKKHDGSRETSFAQLKKDERKTSGAPHAIRRIMAFVHARKDDFHKWSLENPRMEVRTDTLPKRKRRLVPKEGKEVVAKKVRVAAEEQVVVQEEELQEVLLLKRSSGDEGTFVKGPAPPMLRYEYLLQLSQIRVK